ncbi:MAG: helix-turn-helix domain-containing protein [Oscillospiraceae bacterium]
MAKGKFEYWLSGEGLLLLEGWARDGLTDEQIAKNIGIQRTTLYDWKKRHPDISDALKKGKEIIDREVENALLKRALGYEYQEDMFEIGPQGRKVRQTTKHVSPDVGAAFIWLKNRKPETWRDRPADKTPSDTEEDNLFGAIEEAVKNEV